MRNLFRFIIFLIYTIGIFFINNNILLLCIFIFNIFLLAIFRINILKAIKKLLKLFPFILFTAIINLIIENWEFAILISTKLILVCNTSYIYSKTITYMEFSQIIEKLVYPLKIFGVNPKDIGLIISIALAFVPIMKDKINKIKDILKVKGIKPSKYNIVKNSSLIFKPFFISALQRTNEIEMSLKAKGYEE